MYTGLPAWAGGPYFDCTGHRTLYYERYKAGTTSLVQTTSLEIGNIGHQGSSRVVYYAMTVNKANGKPMYGGKADLCTLIGSNDDVSLDLGGTLKAMLHNMFPGAEITGKGNPAILPSDMKPGDILPESHNVLHAGALKFTLDVTDRQVLRSERISTPAGSFDCMVVLEHKVEAGPMYSIEKWTYTWYAPGIGYVRHDSYDRKMRILTSEILVSID